jgi:hypothetical protein
LKARLAALAAAACMAASAGAAAGCGGGGVAAPVEPRIVATEPRWEDVFDTMPELVAVIHPAALRSDPVYGSLLRRAIELARQQSRVVAEARALDAMEDAEEVILGLRQDATRDPDDPAGSEGEADVVVVIRGVRADIDPATLVDGDGRPLWSPGPTGRVRELVRSVAPDGPPDVRANADAVSLFELPGRTWLIASGDTRLRARGVFARPLGRPPLRFGGTEEDDAAGKGASEALALVRMDGPALVSRIRALRPRGALGTVGRRLQAVTLELTGTASDPTSPDARARGGGSADRDVRATLAYADEDAAAFAEITVSEVLGAIGRKNPNDLGWLGSAAVQRPGKRLVLTAPLPAAFVRALSHLGVRPAAERGVPETGTGPADAGVPGVQEP